MVETGWFAGYCNLTKDEKWLEREFEMENEQKLLLFSYGRLYETVVIMSLDFDGQVKCFPKERINIADEIALLFHDDVIMQSDLLYRKEMLSMEDCKLINLINNKFMEMNAMDKENVWTLAALEDSDVWEYCRKKARILLHNLYDLKE